MAAGRRRVKEKPVLIRRPACATSRPILRNHVTARTRMQRLIPWTMLVVALGCLGPLRAQDGPPPLTWLLPTPSIPQLETLRPLDEINTPALPDEVGQAPLQSLSSKTDGPLGSLTSNVVLRDPRALREEPIPVSEWRADNAWKLDVTGPVFLFGQLGA